LNPNPAHEKKYPFDLLLPKQSPAIELLSGGSVEGKIVLIG
jgi:hypothetical protein